MSIEFGVIDWLESSVGVFSMVINVKSRWSDSWNEGSKGCFLSFPSMFGVPCSVFDIPSLGAFLGPPRWGFPILVAIPTQGGAALCPGLS